MGERGQATVELLAGVPALLLAGLICLQLLGAGYTLTLADGAVEAGAIAATTGEPAEQAARDALPDWAEEAVSVEQEGGRITVRVRPPSLIGAVSRALEVSSTAWVRRPDSSP